MGRLVSAPDPTDAAAARMDYITATRQCSRRSGDVIHPQLRHREAVVTSLARIEWEKVGVLSST